MIDATLQGDLARWLEQATHGLPQPAAAAIRAELAAHVEDAVADYVQQGFPPSEAYQRALAELGDPRTAAHGFNDVYRGRRHYIAAMIASILLLVEAFGFRQVYAALDITDYTTSSRIFFVLDHIFFSSLIFYVVIALRRLMMWRFNNQAVYAPSNVVLGGIVAYLVGNLPLELMIDSWDPVPTLLNTSNVAEWVGVLFMHGGYLLMGIGIFWLGVSVLPTRNGLVKGVAVIGGIQGVVMIAIIVLMHLNAALSYIFFAFSLLFGLILWPMVCLLFFQAIYTYRRLPVQTA